MTTIIITLFSDETVRLGDEDSARVLDGDYPIRVKSKVLATLREFAAQPGTESVVGFLPVVRESTDFYQHYPLPFPEDITQYNAANPLKLTPLVSGLYKNHGFEICHEGKDSFAMVACENGVYKVTPPAEADGEWECEQLMDTPASDILYLDFDGDGERELLVLSPFHGDTLTIYKKINGSFIEVYRHGKRLPFLHAIWGAEIGGKVYGFIGNREEDRDLIAIYWNGEAYVYDQLDQGAGAANVLHFRAEGKDMLLAANRETDEIAVYTLNAEG